ncbi:NADH-quinone oxidoreductase subunit NuoN [Candidatus Erwinia haradaeae]|uniref:NADH-quinone oxidoreductase subunit N n=1 Tax=Candidatus Erwinia haradaeae TaxID=1922217 RepID=A0A451DG98_9GAMM|nr:NADH-quinone oxidoreductase subunit NuoN [Candidatus Erwinia haradaeae]VFP85647.1 NADH-quinone oxidoreductase subunit N [Candidatus Erwinia haradaeae]
MTVINQQFILMIPLLILSLTVVIIMLGIGLKRNHRFCAAISFSSLSLVLLSLYFVVQVKEGDVTPLLRIDRYSVFYTILVVFSSLSACIFSYPWIREYPKNREEFYLLIILSTLGGVVLVSANHFSSLFIGIELLSLPLVGLVGYGVNIGCSLEATLKYAILSIAASAFLLFGIALVYAHTGSLGFEECIYSKSNSLSSEALMIAGFSLMIVSFGFKLSLVPFHLWTPDVYQGAPSSVGTFLASASKIAVFSVLMRLLIYTSIKNFECINFALSILAIASILFGNLMALRQKNIKRILGYSSIAHFGYLLITLIAVRYSDLSLEASSVYLVSYLFSTLGVFGVVSLMPNTRNNVSEELSYYRGLFWRNPALAIALTVTIFSFAGVPMTLGFIGKFFLISLGVYAHLWVLTIAMVLGSAIGLYYYLRVIIGLYLAPNKSIKHLPLHRHSALHSTDMTVILFAALSIILGIYPQPIIELVHLIRL